jgi:four helix bundle protein
MKRHGEPENIEHGTPNGEVTAGGQDTASNVPNRPLRRAQKKPSDLQDRLIDFAVRTIRLAEALPKTAVGNHVRGQIIRSGTSPAPNYGEAQSAESRTDFVHKIKIVLKELRETYVWLLVIRRAALIKPEAMLNPLIVETNELISIFVSSVNTASKRKP